MQNKTNLITIIASKQTKYSKIINSYKRLSKFDICFQNYLFESKFNLDGIVNNNIILIVFSKDDDIDVIKNLERNFSDASGSFSFNNVPFYVLIEDRGESKDTDVIKCCFATYGLVPTDWGGNVDFLNEKELEKYLCPELF